MNGVCRPVYPIPGSAAETSPSHIRLANFPPITKREKCRKQGRARRRKQQRNPHAILPRLTNSESRRERIEGRKRGSEGTMMKRLLYYTNPQGLQEQRQQGQTQQQERCNIVEETMTTIKESGNTPLSAIAEAFEDLVKRLKLAMKDRDREEEEEESELRLDTFCDACILVSVLFSCLGLAFKFAESEYVAKVRNLLEASKRYSSLQNVVDFDVANGTVRSPGSHSRNLRRVRQGLDLIRALFEQFLSTDDYSLKDAATAAYSQVCAPYHTWAVRTAVYAGMYTLPSRDQLLLRLNETDQSAEKKMRRYINASLPVIEYIDKLYISRNITLDW